jgi:hypothetical protein
VCVCGCVCVCVCSQGQGGGRRSWAVLPCSRALLEGACARIWFAVHTHCKGTNPGCPRISRGHAVGPPPRHCWGAPVACVMSHVRDLCARPRDACSFVQELSTDEGMMVSIPQPLSSRRASRTSARSLPPGAAAQGTTEEAAQAAGSGSTGGDGAAAGAGAGARRLSRQASARASGGGDQGPGGGGGGAGEAYVQGLALHGPASRRTSRTLSGGFGLACVRVRAFGRACGRAYACTNTNTTS